MWDGGQNEMGFGEARQVIKGGRRGERGKGGYGGGMYMYVCMLNMWCFGGKGPKGS